jgi:hypothetical protein
LLRLSWGVCLVADFAMNLASVVLVVIVPVGIVVLSVLA